MQEIASYYYKLAIDLFHDQKYDFAVECFVNAYERGEYREEILNVLYDCFITPNESEFQQNYNVQSDWVKPVTYEETAIDFLPVSSTRYWMFDKKEKTFLGRFDTDKTLGGNDEKEFDSILIADFWDIREIYTKAKEKNWNKVYLVLNEKKEYFYSFFKIEGFAPKYLSNAVCFNCQNEMIEYFSKAVDCYLPKVIYSHNNEKYASMLRDIHLKRINDTGTVRNNVYLSICMPTYIRGHVALRSVLYMLNSSYDSEIEIIVSDNGSEKYVEEYKAISQIKDSRLKYYRSDENVGFPSNICRVLELAQGKFAVLTSDEDMMLIENLSKFLKTLKNNENSGMVLSRGIGVGFARREPNIYKRGLPAIERCLDANYMTGIALNMDICKQHNLLEEYNKMRGDVFAEFYPHVTLSMFACQWGECNDCGDVLWTAGENLGSVFPPALTPVGDELHIRSYTLPENRINQLNSEIELLDKLIGKRDEIFYTIFFKRIEKRYYLVNMAFKLSPKTFSQAYNWEEICKTLYCNSKKLKELYNLPSSLAPILDKMYEEWSLRRPC